MQGAVSELGQVRSLGLANLTPGDRHCAKKPAHQATKKYCRRYWNWHSGYNSRYQGCPKRHQINYRRNDYGMRFAEPQLEQYQTAHSDRK